MSHLHPSIIARGFIMQLEKNGLNKAISQLAALIIENRIHNQTDEILESIQYEYQHQYGIVEATTTSVHSLSADLKKRIQAIVAQKTNTKKVILHEELDPTVLGGVKIAAPGLELDLSLKTKLAKLKA